MKPWFLLLLALDLLSKVGALYYIPSLQWGGYPFGGVPIFSDFFGISFSLNTVFNTGAAWGLFSGYPALLCFLRIGIVLGLGIYLFSSRSPILKMRSVWLIGVGAIGNAIDYLLYGHVVDFFHFVFWGYSFPVFNLADSFITLGVIGMLFFHRESKQTI